MKLPLPGATTKMQHGAAKTWVGYFTAQRRAGWPWSCAVSALAESGVGAALTWLSGLVKEVGQNWVS